MITYQGEIVINRPVGEVFAYATTFENFPKWSDTQWVKRLTNGPSGPGTRLQIAMGKGPMQSEAEFETMDWEPDKRWAFRTVSDSPVIWDGSFDFESLGPTSARVKAEGHVTLRGWRRLLEPLVRRELPKSEQAELGRLKELLET